MQSWNKDLVNRVSMPSLKAIAFPSAMTNMTRAQLASAPWGTTRLVVGCALVLGACAPLPGSDDDSPAPGEGAGGSVAVVPWAPGTSGGSTGAGTGGQSMGEGTGGETVEGPLPPYEAPQGMLRRLTRSQFTNAMRDVFAAEIDPEQLDADSHSGDFIVIGASSVVTSPRGVEQYGTAVESAVNGVFDSEEAEAFVGCVPTAADDECTTGYIERMGRRAYRRPLEDAEVSQLLDVAQVASDELGSVQEGLRWATIAMFSSPQFIYRPELGTANEAGGLKIEGYEMASRLSFLIWNSLPDDLLLDEAAAGQLNTPENVQAAATRMLEEAPGRAAVGAFAEDYMRLDRILTQAKDPQLYPEYGEALQNGMIEDMLRVWEIITLEEDESALNLFSTTKVVANAELAQLYGLDASGLDSNTFKEFDLPEDSTRRGILSKSGFLSQFANQKEGSPTLRGKFMREVIMCTIVRPPPAGVVLDLVDPPADMPMTKRQRLAQHNQSPACANCHGSMDPMGLPFENFDAIGKYRTTDRGLPIDASGEFEGVAVADSVQLGQVMSESDLVANCLLRKYYSYAMGHEEREVDEVVIKDLEGQFASTGFRLKQLILDLVATEAFSAVASQPDL